MTALPGWCESIASTMVNPLAFRRHTRLPSERRFKQYGCQ